MDHKQKDPGSRPMLQVLACGDSFTGLDFPERDRVRERLREEVADTGLVFTEHYWVWDETDRAQLLVASTPDAAEADQLRQRLHEQGIRTRITTRLPF